ncbi:MAG: hypothetical protein WCG51_04325 [Elusimicrobiota bacterium]
MMTTPKNPMVKKSDTDGIIDEPITDVTLYTRKRVMIPLISAGAVVVAHENISPRKEAEETLSNQKKAAFFIAGESGGRHMRSSRLQRNEPVLKTSRFELHHNPRHPPPF